VAPATNPGRNDVPVRAAQRLVSTDPKQPPGYYVAVVARCYDPSRSLRLSAPIGRHS